MARDAAVESEQEFHLAGLLLVTSAVVLGLVLTLAVLLTERERRGASAIASPAPASELAPAAPAPPAAAPAAPALAKAAPAAAAPAASAALASPAAAAPAKAAPAAASGAGSAAAGATAFAATCGGCHPNGKAGLGPALKGLSAEAITRGVREGKGMMPAYKPEAVSDQQLLDMIAFLSTAG